MGWHDSGNCHWCDWRTDDSEYDYYVRLASNTYSNDRCNAFNIRSSLPNVSQPSGSEEYCVVNGSIGSNTPYAATPVGFNVGGQVTLYSYNAQQYNWGSTSSPGTPRDFNYLVMYTWGGGNMYFTTASNMNAGAADITLGCPARSDGTGEGGMTATSSHCFIGSNGTTNYFGYSTGITGAATVSYMTSQYGGTCAVLDGGGSTYCRYLGTVKKNTDGRWMYNALAVYRKRKSTPTTYTISTSVSPSGSGTVSGGGSYNSGASCTLTANPSSGYTFQQWQDGNQANPRSFTVTGNATYTATFIQSASEDNRRLGLMAGKSFVLNNGTLKTASPWYKLKNNSLVGDPEGIYTLSNGSLSPLILKYYIDYHENGGNPVSDSFYYWGNETTFPTPTHSSYESRNVLFGGWFKDNTFLSQTSKIGSNATGDRDLYAKWYQTKTQYSGYYTYSGSGSKSIGSDDIAISVGNVYWDNNSGTYDHDVIITSVGCDVDYCNTSGWTNYKKPRTTYGYYTSSGSGGWHEQGTVINEGGSGGSVSCSFTLPAGAWVGFRSYPINDGLTRNHAYFYSGSYNYSGDVRAYANWQDSDQPPSGRWDSGYPLTRTVTRYYNGSSWTNWS